MENQINEVTAKPAFTIPELIACANREVAMRRSCYPKWDKVDSLDKLTPGRKKELAMMKAISTALKEGERAIAALFVLRHKAATDGYDGSVGLAAINQCIDALKGEGSQPNV